jgi:predicted cupin superfamily sugar epimerase
MKSADYWKEKLKLTPHPEGGYYREIYRSKEIIPANILPRRFRGSHCFSTSIYYLLEASEISVFHRIRSVEIFHFYDGSPLMLYMIDKEGKLTTSILGNNPDDTEKLQVLIPSETWLGARVMDEGLYTLTGCTVSPGFDFNDFEIGVRKELILSYPHHSTIIEELTR